jgi:nifR3 family TIM-barrel protein
VKSIWKTIPKPILAFAPMEDVTDTVFRQIVASCAKPDIFFTEFMNCDGFMSEGREVVSKRLKFTQSEHPIIAQLWGINPKNFLEVAKVIVSLGFDGVDINMGCPQRRVVKDGACAALIKNPSLATEIIEATKEGVNGKIPVSVKTRIGYKTIETEKWISHLLSCDIDALIVHGRTAHEMSKVPAHWDEIGKVVGLRDQLKKETVILGNGDVKNYNEAKEKCVTHHLDGVMIGRGVFDNPWCFDKSDHPHQPTTKELLILMKKHVELFEKIWGNKKHFAILKKFFKIYINGFDGASEYRIRVMETNDSKSVLKIVEEILRGVTMKV